MITFSTSSWTLHGKLGQVRYEHNLAGESWLEAGDPAAGMPLTDLPAFVAKDNIPKIELCHFHFPSIKPDYLAQLRQAIQAAGLTLENLLIDRGNLSDPNDNTWQAELDLCKMWLRIAAELGANGCRIDCGTEPPSPASKARAADALQQLSDYATTLGLKLTTENFRQTSLQPEDLLEIITMADRPLNLCLDFGNAIKSGDKYGTLQKLLPHSTSLHCKGQYSNGELDRTEFAHSIRLVTDADFSGFVSLIFDGTENEWAKTLELKQAFTDNLN